MKMSGFKRATESSIADPSNKVLIIFMSTAPHTHAQSPRSWSNRWGGCLPPSYQKLSTPEHFQSPPQAPPAARDREKEEIEQYRRFVTLERPVLMSDSSWESALKLLTSNKNSVRVLAESKPSNSITRSSLKTYTLPSSSRPVIEGN